MSSPAIDTSIRTTGAESLHGGLLSTPAAPRRKESFDAHLNRGEKAGRAPEKPARKSRRDEPSDEPTPNPASAPPPVADVNPPAQNAADESPPSNAEESLKPVTQQSADVPDDGAADQLGQGEELSQATDAELSASLIDASAGSSEEITEVSDSDVPVSDTTTTLAMPSPVSLPDVVDSLPQNVEELPLTNESAVLDARTGEQLRDDIGADVDVAPASERSAPIAVEISPPADSQVARDQETAAQAIRPTREPRKTRTNRLEGATEHAGTNPSAASETAPAVLASDVAEAVGLKEAVSDSVAEEASTANSTTPAVSNTDNVGVSSPARLAQHLLARGTDRAAKESRINDGDQARLLDRVARAVRTAESRQGVVRLRLHPPELGSLRIELRMQQGVMTARLEAETPTARTLLMDNVQALRERLNEQGVRVESFDVDVMDRRSSDDPRSPEQRHARDDAQRMPRRDGESGEASLDERAIGPSRQLGNPGQLNVIV